MLLTMERPEIALVDSRRKFTEISMKWDTVLNLDSNILLGLASKIGHLKGSLSYWLSTDTIGKMRKETIDSFLKIETDLNRIENEIDNEYN